MRVLPIWALRLPNPHPYFFKLISLPSRANWPRNCNLWQNLNLRGRDAWLLLRCAHCPNFGTYSGRYLSPSPSHSCVHYRRCGLVICGKTKRSWCAKGILLKSREAGGASMPDLEDYYTASIISQLRTWFQRTPDSLWGALERDQTPQKDLSSWLCSRNIGDKLPEHISPTIRA